MITDRPFQHTGRDITYPDKGSYINGELEIDDYPPDVLRRGLGNLLRLASQVKSQNEYVAFIRDNNSHIFQNITHDGLATRLGLSYQNTEGVHQTCKTLAWEIMRAQIAECEARRRVALLGYMAVAESQTLTAANKRVGRVLYGRLLYGYSPENIRKGVDAVLDDAVPQPIEERVLLQNIVRCQNATETAIDEFGGVYVPGGVALDLDRQRGLLHDSRFCTNENPERRGDLFEDNILQLKGILLDALKDETLAENVACVLIQKDYGPAAWLLCCKDTDIRDITPDIATGLIKTNTQLLQMRIIALLNTIANGGKFVDITDSDSETAERLVRVSDWTPTEVTATANSTVIQ